MRIALLVGANPRTCNDSARVFLSRGTWKVEVKGLEDSKVILSLNSEMPLRYHISKETNPIEIKTRPNIAQVSFELRGSETFLNIIAERISSEV